MFTLRRLLRSIVSNPRPRKETLRRVVAGGLSLALLAGQAGCGRYNFRKWTDREVDHLLHQKADHPLWNTESFPVYPDPRARFADPTNPDRPPMPPDDPGAYDFSPNPQKPRKAGIAYVEGTGYLTLLAQWDAENRAKLAAERAAEEEEELDPELVRAQQQLERNYGLSAPETEIQQELSAPVPRPGEKKETGPRRDGDAGPRNGGNGAEGRPSGEGRTKERRTPILPAVPAFGGEGRRDPKVVPASHEDAGEPQADLPARGAARGKDWWQGEPLFGPGVGPGGPQEGEGKQPYLIDLEQAVELGLINSREYQLRREALYLSALPVTLERYSFAAQFFAEGRTTRERAGREFAGGFRDIWQQDTVFGVSKLFVTGGQLLAAIANTTVINLGGGPPNTSVSTLTLDLIQPLLRGAGRAVTLEPLTQAERGLLYAVRDFAKFRQEFFVFIAAGQPTFIPGVQAGVSAITGGTVGTPGAFEPGAAPLARPFGAVPGGIVIAPGTGGRLFATGVGGATPQGYYNTLVSKYTLLNQYKNIQSLQIYYDRFQVYESGGIVNNVQVGQVEQQLLGSIDRVLAAQASFRSDLDQFKLQLGLPLTIDLDLMDTPLRPVLEQTERYERLSEQAREAFRAVQGYGLPEEADRLRGRLMELLTSSRLTRGTEARSRLLRRWAEWRGLTDTGVNSPFQRRLVELRNQRRPLVERQAELGDRFPEADAARLADLQEEIILGEFEEDLRGYEQKGWEGVRDPILRASRQQRQFRDVIRSFLFLLETVVKDRQRQIRESWPELPAVCVNGVDLLRADDDESLAVAYRAALSNRLDLMNRRAQLVDSWRKIALAANALLGAFNVEYNLTSTTPPDAAVPLAFAGSRTRHQLIFNYELPLVRIAERNNYRSTLIAYQQERRFLMLAEDQILFAVRLELRGLRQIANTYYRVRQRALELAYRRVDQALEAFEQPAAPAGGGAGVVGPVGPPGGGAGGGGERGGDPAALTNQLLGAQNSLLGVQNDIYNTWIGYLSTRMSFYRDLGIMPLNPRGVWIDGHATCECDPPSTPGGERGSGAPEELPPPRVVPGS